MLRLKQETMQDHAVAERHVRILDPDATNQTYARYLTRMLGFHRPMERAFSSQELLAATGFDAPARRKQQLLAADLSALESGTDAIDCDALPDITDLADALGAAYVLEGSTLGGAFILSHLPPSLAALRGKATRFLEGYGRDTGRMWRSFTSIANATLGTENHIERAVHAAQDTFRRLTAWLDETPQAPPHPFMNRAREGTV